HTELPLLRRTTPAGRREPTYPAADPRRYVLRAGLCRVPTLLVRRAAHPPLPASHANEAAGGRYPGGAAGGQRISGGTRDRELLTRHLTDDGPAPLPHARRVQELRSRRRRPEHRSLPQLWKAPQGAPDAEPA